MPRGYRYAIIALVGWLTLSANNGPLPEQFAAYNQTQVNRGIDRAADRITSAINNAVKPEPNDRGCDPDREDRHSDLCAQWKAADAAEESADWAARAFWLGAAGTALLLWTLIYTARGTRAATEAVETQINSDRPLLQLTALVLKNFDPFGAEVSFEAGYEITNLGGTGCWIEMFNYAIVTSTKAEPIKKEIHAFIAAGKGLTTTGDGQRQEMFFEGHELLEFANTPQLFCVGSLVYRNAGGARWETGFCVRSVIENGLGKPFNPVPQPELWFDRRIHATPKRWYQRQN